ncbi:hypothetical protein CES86_4112 [Brucella lupini]|uniref:Uncharacterized protein n=1 Tax=Brucella lupini TaxID=255457 RepID=A0A256GGC9_9HYPH|nr:hypothetical protein CES86_4112 [Brucella lupini]
MTVTLHPYLLKVSGCLLIYNFPVLECTVQNRFFYPAKQASRNLINVWLKTSRTRIRGCLKSSSLPKV